ncbi:MAG: hypothetical protein AB7G13_19030 [Lautropia sp.]
MLFALVAALGAGVAAASDAMSDATTDSVRPATIGPTPAAAPLAPSPPRSAAESPDPARTLPADAVPQVVKPAAAPSKTANPSVIVVEGGGTRALWIDPNRIADFGAGGAAVQPALRPPAPGELTDRARAGKRDDDRSAKSAADTGSTAATTVSPVFLDAGGRARALPGGVIVGFAASVSNDAAAGEFAAAGVTPLRRIGDRMWLVESPPGLATLEIAERLNASGRFAFVQPNWWNPRPTK